MSINGFIKRNIYWINDYLRGGVVKHFYNDLETVLSDKKIGLPIQQNHLSNLLVYATEKSEFYKPYKGQPLKNFPVVNKAILNENHNMVSVPIEEIPDQNGQKIYIQKTSGSTGTPFAVPQDTRKRQRRVAELKYFNEQIGFKSHEMLGQCRIWTKWQNKSKWQSFKENIIPINIKKWMRRQLLNCFIQ